MTTATLESAPVVGIWDHLEAELFARYRVELEFRSKVMGGVPQNPKIIEGWIRQKFAGNDDEVRELLLRTLDQLGMEPDAGELTREQLDEIAKHAAAEQKGNTFARTDDGCCLGDYQIKAMLKEATSIIYPWGPDNKWGPTKKAPRSFFAERVFVDEEWIPLGRLEPDGKHLQIGQVTGPKGPRSTLTYYDWCKQPTIAFTVSSLEDMVKPEHWQRILLTGQREGLGAIRSLGHGQFKVKAFDRL